MSLIEGVQHLKIPLEEIKLATNNFGDQNFIARGGFGRVYIGKLIVFGQQSNVAVKRLDRAFGQGDREFLIEIQMLSCYHHKNLITLVGFCDDDGENILVYEHAKHESLDKHLSDVNLSWMQRLQISVGAARALDYLHNQAGHRVLHRDIKSSNILLDENWEAKISDFGLSKIGPSKVEFTFLVTSACGTFGYVDPQYMRTGILTKESDVYSFGVVLFEILCGRLAHMARYEDERTFIAPLAQQYYENNTLDVIIPPNLKNQMKTESVKMFSMVAYQCLKENRKDRPTIGWIVENLEKALKLQKDEGDSSGSLDFLELMGITPKRYSYYELACTTNNFAESEKLGQGVFGAVYRGYLDDSREHIAIKRVSKSSRKGIEEYASEVRNISRLRHMNLVLFNGWCHQKHELLLVYEFIENGSLDSHIFNAKSLLGWHRRYEIAQGLASALLYLHEGCEQCILHRNIKPTNVMLDSQFNARLGDFKLAMMFDHEKGSHMTMFAGPVGYMAPEVVATGKASTKSDVYSFGVVALEIACGRKPIEYIADQEKQIALVEWVWELYGAGTLLEAVDPRLGSDYIKEEIKSLMIVGLWCVHPYPNLRPSMRQVVKVLQVKYAASRPILPRKMPGLSY